MAKPAHGLIKRNRTSECHVGVGLHPEMNKIKVNRETFWVSKSQKDVAEWFCLRKEVEPDHEHGKDSPCFTIIFDKDGTPFKGAQFISDKNGYARSDDVRSDVVGDDATLYNYRITMKGKDTLDPGGGVRP